MYKVTITPETTDADWEILNEMFNYSCMYEFMTDAERKKTEAKIEEMLALRR